MLSPSTAPRWNTATSTRRRFSAAWAARKRKRGGAASATRAQAPALTNVRRVGIPLSPLELGGADDERQELFDVRVRGGLVVRREPGDLGLAELGHENRAGARAHVAAEDGAEEPIQHRPRLAAVGAGGQRADADPPAAKPTLGEGEAEAPTGHQGAGLE